MTFEADRGAPLLIGGSDGFALAKAAVEADGKAPGSRVADRAARPHDTIDAGEESRRLCLAVAGAQHNELDRRARRAERLLQR